MSRSLRLTAAALAAVALTPAAAHAASAPFEFQPGPSSAFGNAIAADASGDVWLATYRSGVPGKVLVSVRRVAGAVKLVTTYTAPAGYATLSPKISVRTGVATVAFSQSKGSAGATAVAIRCKVSGCSRAQTVGRAQRVKTEATPVVDELGRSFVFWRGTSSKGPRLQWALTSNGRFGKPHTLARTGTGLAAVADPRGGELLGWTDSDGRVVVARRKRGEVLKPNPLSTGAGTDLQLAVSGQEAVAAWRGGRGDGEGQPGTGSVDAAIRSAGSGGFGVETVFAGNGRNVRLAADGQGHAAVAFADAGANPDAAFLATSEVSVREPGAGFGTPVVLGPGPLYSAPAVTIASGRVFGAWMSQTDQQQAATIQATEVRQGATGPAIDLGPGSAPLAAGPVLAWAGPSSYLGVAL